MSVSLRDQIYPQLPCFLDVNLTQTMTNLLAAMKILQQLLKQCQLVRVSSLKKGYNYSWYFLELWVYVLGNVSFITCRVNPDSYICFSFTYFTLD